jgi:6-phosphogluconate dehydrogenase
MFIPHPTVSQTTATYEFGIVGTGVMAYAVIERLARRGVSVAFFDYDPNVAKEFMEMRARGLPIYRAQTTKELVDVLKTPPKIMAIFPDEDD